MKITVTLDQDEITEAIRQFVANNSLIGSAKNIDVSITGGRGSTSAVISIDSEISGKPTPKTVEQPPKAESNSDPKSTSAPVTKNTDDDVFNEDIKPDPTPDAKPEQEKAPEKVTETVKGESVDLFGDDSATPDPDPVSQPEGLVEDDELTGGMSDEDVDNLFA